jgi:5-methylthioadenosine/S-adenosylhomocysteine deaminase
VEGLDRGHEQRIVAKAVVTCDAEGSIHRPGAVTLTGGRIVSVGPAEPGETTRDGVLLPGLVNCHCHSPMTLFRGAAEELPLRRFLREVLWPREARLTREDVYWGMTLACAELLRFGVTTTCEMYVHEEGILDAVLEAGTRCVLTPGVADVPGWVDWRERLDQVTAFLDEQGGRHDRVEVGVAAHAAYSLPLEALDALAAAARARDALVHLHLAETRDECAELEQAHGGKSVPTILAERGCLDGRVLAAHSIWLSDDDLRILHEHDVGIAHCPTSNAKLAAGIARLADMLRLALRVGLGTDGPASNNDLDLWEEMRLAGLLARIGSGDPELLPAHELLALATREGGRTLGRDDLGALEAGAVADLILLRLDDPSFVPLVEDRDLVSHLVWSAPGRLVTDVWVAGQQVVRDGECLTVDEERARREVQERAVRLARG